MCYLSLIFNACVQNKIVIIVKPSDKSTLIIVCCPFSVCCASVVSGNVLLYIICFINSVYRVECMLCFLKSLNCYNLFFVVVIDMFYLQ